MIYFVLLGLLAALPILFLLFVLFASLVRFYDKRYGERRKGERGHPLFTTWRPLNWLYAFLCGFYWADCPRCGKSYGGHESGGTQGGRSTCFRCPGEVGWFPYGQTTSRYWNGTGWEGDPVERPYFDLNPYP